MRHDRVLKLLPLRTPRDRLLHPLGEHVGPDPGRLERLVVELLPRNRKSPLVCLGSTRRTDRRLQRGVDDRPQSVGELLFRKYQVLASAYSVIIHPWLQSG